MLLSAGGPENDAALRALVAGGVSWPAVAVLAGHERAASVLRDRLRRLGDGPEVERGLAALEPAARVWEFRLHHLEARLLELLDALSEAGIEALLLKGSGLAFSIYPGFTARPMWDLDVLVTPEQAAAAWALSQAHGWAWRSEAYPAESYAGHHHLPPLDDEAGTGARLEIHTEPSQTESPFGLTAAELWRDARTVERDGRRVTVPSPSHQVVHACVHFAWGHGLGDKVWRSLRDVWAFSECDEVDWGDVVRSAEEYRAHTCCYWTLRLAARLARVRVPEDVLEALEPALPRRLLTVLERHHTLGIVPSGVRCPSIGLNRTLWRLSMVRSWRGRGFLRPPTVNVDFGEDAAVVAQGRLSRQIGARMWWRSYLRHLLSAAS